MIIRTFTGLAMLLILGMALLGCGTQPPAVSKESPKPSVSTVGSDPSGANPYLTFDDQAGRKIVLKQKPERIIVLNTELLQVFDQVGGRMVGRATAPGVPVPEKAKSAEEVGLISEVNLERIWALKPDLVIGQPLFHSKLAAQFDQSGIPFAILTIKSYDDMQNNARLLGKVVGKPDEAAAAVKNMNERIQLVLDRVPDAKPNFALLTFMMGSVSIQKSSSIALDIAERLKLKNVAAAQVGGSMGSIPFSMEKLVELNPDYLLFVVHGTDEEGEQMLKTSLKSNQAWASLKAVKENRYTFLPSSLFVNNPGLNLDQSFEYMAKLAYPQAFSRN